MTPSNKLLGYLVASKSEAVLRGLKEKFPDPKDIPLLDDAGLVFYKAIYANGPQSKEELDTLTGKLFSIQLNTLGEEYERDAKGLDEESAAGVLKQLVKEERRQSLIVASSEVAAKLLVGEITPEEGSELLRAASLKAAADAGYKLFGQRVEEAQRHLKQQVDEGVELTLGLSEVDEIFTPRRGCLHIIAGPTSHAKTATAIRLINRAIDAKKRPLVVAIMGFEDNLTIPFKIAAQRMQIPISNFMRYHAISPEERSAVDAAMVMVQEIAPFVHIFDPSSLGSFERQLDQIKPDVIILDYVQEYATWFGQSGDLRRDVSVAAKDFKALVQKYNAYGFMVTQVRRRETIQKGNFGPRRPNLYDLKESGDLENIADSVLLLWWPWKDSHKEDNALDKQIYHIEVAKDRMGKCGDVRVQFIGETQTFKDRFST